MNSAWTACGRGTTSSRLYGAADEAHFEGWQILSAMAVTTFNVSQLGMLVTGGCHRNPDLLAEMARTVDHLPGGRAVLGIGSGWMDKDEIEHGYPLRTPGQRLDALVLGLRAPYDLREVERLVAAAR